jgi:hypothetical protein
MFTFMQRMNTREHHEHLLISYLYFLYLGNRSFLPLSKSVRT